MPWIYGTGGFQYVLENRRISAAGICLAGEVDGEAES